MRLSNAWRKLKFAGAVAVGVAILLFCAYQLWSAWATGRVQPITRYLDWVTFQSNPVWFVSSLMAYTLGVTMLIGLFALVLIDYRKGWRWRTRQDLDYAIRQAPEER
jgi:hypothetical protein